MARKDDDNVSYLWLSYSHICYKGDMGEGLKINYYVENIQDLFDSDIIFKYGDIIFIKNTNELKFWGYDNVKDLGKLFNSKITTNKISGINSIIIKISQNRS